MKVTVTQPVQVVHDGTKYLPGDTADVPAAVAAEWLASGWVSKVPATAPRKGTTPTP